MTFKYNYWEIGLEKMGAVTMLEWINDNNGALMVLLTGVYVIATVVICAFNRRSIEAAHEDSLAAEARMQEQIRARIVPRLTVLEGDILCLGFYNIGLTHAVDVVISVSDDWIEALAATEKLPKTAESLRRVKNQKSYFVPGEERLYPLCVPADGTSDMEKLQSVPAVIEVVYSSNGITYSDEFVLPLMGAEWLVETSDYVRLEKKKIKAIEGLTKQVKGLAKGVSE